MVSTTKPIAQLRLLAESNGEEPTISAIRAPATMAKNDEAHRKKLLYKLGFENTDAIPAPPSTREPSRGSLLGRVQTSTQPLKYDENFDKLMLEKKQRAMERANQSTTSVFSALGALFVSSQQQPAATEPASRDDIESFKPSSMSSVDTEVLSESGSSSDGSKSGGRRRGLTFNDEVTVVPIPKRDEYSKRVRDRLWVNARDLQSQVARNTVEFASEGWDWRNAYTDEEMYVCAVTGEKVHPVHCESDD